MKQIRKGMYAATMPAPSIPPAPARAPATTEQERVLRDVRDERRRQDRKFGPPPASHTPERWLTILTEETGELAEAILENRLDGPHGVKVELVHVAAVAVRALEALGS
jgi:hypothetical protein